MEDVQRLFIGDKIRDIEDDDCYYEGIVLELNPVKYKITNVFWSGENDNSMNGKIIELKWWITEKLIGDEWIKLTNIN
jgi:hypothetical protein